MKNPVGVPGKQALFPDDDPAWGKMTGWVEQINRCWGYNAETNTVIELTDATLDAEIRRRLESKYPGQNVHPSDEWLRRARDRIAPLKIRGTSRSLDRIVALNDSLNFFSMAVLSWVTFQLCFLALYFSCK